MKEFSSICHYLSACLFVGLICWSSSSHPNLRSVCCNLPQFWVEPCAEFVKKAAGVPRAVAVAGRLLSCVYTGHLYPTLLIFAS